MNNTTKVIVQSAVKLIGAALVAHGQMTWDDLQAISGAVLFALGVCWHLAHVESLAAAAANKP